MVGKGHKECPLCGRQGNGQVGYVGKGHKWCLHGYGRATVVYTERICGVVNVSLKSWGLYIAVWNSVGTHAKVENCVATLVC